MILVGILVLVLAVGSAAVLLAAAHAVSERVQLDVLGATVGFTPMGLLLTGAVLAVALWVGVMLVRMGIARSVRRRQQHKEATRRAEEEGRRAAEEEAERRIEAEREAAREARERAEAAESQIDAMRNGATTGGSAEPASQPSEDEHTSH